MCIASEGRAVFKPSIGVQSSAAELWLAVPPRLPRRLCSVLPFSSMPTCLPPLLARAAADPADGLAALHGSEAGAPGAHCMPILSGASVAGSVPGLVAT